jgi:hypothetical protein
VWNPCKRERQSQELLPTEEEINKKRISDKTAITKPEISKEKREEIKRSFRERQERLTSIK